MLSCKKSLYFIFGFKMKNLFYSQLGAWDRNNVQDSINVAEFFRHPDFSASSMDNDIILLRLVRPAVLGGAYYYFQNL